MITKQNINWRTDPIPYKDLKDGQQILCCFSEREVFLCEWDIEESAFYEIYDGGGPWKIEDLKVWAYFKYPGKEAE